MAWLRGSAEIVGLVFVVTLAASGEPVHARPGADAATDGPLHPDLVANTVRSHVPEVKACYEVALTRDRLLNGKLVTVWTIDTGGKVQNLHFEPPVMPDAQFVACVKRTVEAWRFTPPPPEPVDVAFPFVFQSSESNVAGAVTPRAKPAPPAAAPQGPQWIAARKWLAALGHYDVDALTQLTSFPLAYRTTGMRRQCASGSRDAAALKRWVGCLRKTKSLITAELAASEGVVDYNAIPDPDLEAASKGLAGGEWVTFFLNGDGVSFGFRLLVSDAPGVPPVVKALLVSASFDRG